MAKKIIATLCALVAVSAQVLIGFLQENGSPWALYSFLLILFFGSIISWRLAPTKKEDHFAGLLTQIFFFLEFWIFSFIGFAAVGGWTTGFLSGKILLWQLYVFILSTITSAAGCWIGHAMARSKVSGTTSRECRE